MPRTQTTVVPVDPQEPDPARIEEAAALIKQGGLAVVPTDTVYGLVCDPGQAEAVARIYEVKRRRRDLPLALLLHDMAEVTACVYDVPEIAVRAMQQFWPGPLTVVVGNCREAAASVCAGAAGVGLRLPAHVVPRLVAGSAGCPLASTSANRSGRAPPTTAQEALRDLQGMVPLILDAGPTSLGQESTVVSFLTTPPRLLREGAISLSRLQEALGDIDAGPG